MAGLAIECGAPTKLPGELFGELAGPKNASLAFLGASLTALQLSVTVVASMLTSAYRSGRQRPGVPHRASLALECQPTSLAFLR
jgi:hypothetical protein